MSDTIEVKTTVSFRAWPIPESAIVDFGDADDAQLPSIPLTDLASDVVDALAQRWLDNLYANRGQASPFVIERRPRAA